MSKDGIDETGAEGELLQLHRTVQAFEQRLSRVEARLGLDRPATAESPAAGQPAEQQGSRDHFVRLATVCFVLVGALVLRTAARAGWLTPAIGVALGLAYCGLLLFGPLVCERLLLRRLPQAPVVELCGGLLAVLVILESVYRSRALGQDAGVAALGGLVLAAGLLAWLRQADWSIVTILLGVVAGAVVLGRSASAGPLLVAVCALAVTLGARGGLQHTAVVIPSALALAAGVLLTGRRAGAPPAYPLTMMLSAVGLWVVLTVNLVLRARKLGRLERASFFVVTLGTHGLGIFVAPQAARLAAAALGVALLAATWGWGWLREAALVRSLLVLSVLLLGLSLPWIEPRGVALAVVAVVVQRVGSSMAPGLAARLSGALLVVAVAQAGAVMVPSQSASAAGLGLVVSALALMHYQGAPGRWLRALSLLCALAPLYLAGRVVAWRTLGQGSAFVLAQSLMLCSAAVAMLWLGRWRHRPEVVSVGVLLVLVLGARILLWDMARLEGGFLVGAVLLLGVAALVTSLVLRRRNGAESV